MTKNVIKTLPFSGIRREDVTDALVEQARAQAVSKGLKQFGFRVAKTDPYHTLIVTDGGTIANPTGARGDNEYDPLA